MYQMLSLHHLAVFPFLSTLLLGCEGFKSMKASHHYQWLV